MSGPVSVEPDGTRVYVSGKRYRPRDGSRGYTSHRPADPRAVRFHTKWFVPLDLLPLGQRPPMPETRPDSDAYEHIKVNLRCQCEVCLRPQAAMWHRKWRREQGLRG